MTDENGIAWYPVLSGMGDIDEATGAPEDVQLNIVYTDVLPRVGEYVSLRIYESPTRGVLDAVDATLRVTRIEHRAWRQNVGGIWVTLEPEDDAERQRVLEGLRRLEGEAQP